MRSLTLLLPNLNSGLTLTSGGTFSNVGREPWQLLGSNADAVEKTFSTGCDHGDLNASMALKPDYGRISDRPHPLMIVSPPRSGQAPRTDPSSAPGA